MSPAIAGFAALAVAATPVSQSKLGVVVLGNDATSQALLAACPRLAVFPIDSSTASRAATQIAGYKAACSGATAIVQVGGKGLAVGPTTAATNWPTTWLGQVQAVNASLVDGVEGPSEPVAATPGDLAAFWSSFADLVNASTYQPVVGALATGLPSAVTLPDGGSENAFCETARLLSARTYPWAWSYHSRSTDVSTNATTEAATTLAYRQIRDQCALGGKPLFITEAGPAARAWQGTDGTWLAFLDAQLSQDSEVQGAAVFEAAGSDIFKLDPAVDALKSELANPTTPDGGTPDAGADGGGTGGVITPGVNGPGGTLVPSKTSGCSTGGPVLAALALLPALLLLRRRGR